MAGWKCSDARRLKVLEGENRKLKKLLAEALDNAMLRDLNAKTMVTPVVKRQAVVSPVRDNLDLEVRKS